MSLENCRLIEIPCNIDDSSTLCYFENSYISGFSIERIYYLNNLLINKTRGNHAYLNIQQIIIPLNGQITVNLDDGKNKKDYLLKHSTQGLYISELIWRIVTPRIDKTIILVLCNKIYKETQKINNYEEFLLLKTKNI